MKYVGIRATDSKPICPKCKYEKTVVGQFYVCTNCNVQQLRS